MSARALRLALAVLLACVAGIGAGTARSAKITCAKVAAPPAHARARKRPTSRLDPSKTWTATFVTTCGTFVVRLDVEVSPHTVASFVSLARSGFYTNTVFHRIVPGFVIQGGDPTASGAGGPGYTVVDRPPASTRYTHGVVAMAKTQLEPPGTSGSQFFVTTADVRLDPDYAVLGRVVRGLAVVDAIGRFGDPNDPAGRPTRVVVLRRVTISTS